MGGVARVFGESPLRAGLLLTGCLSLQSQQPRTRAGLVGSQWIPGLPSDIVLAQYQSSGDRPLTCPLLKVPREEGKGYGLLIISAKWISCLSFVSPSVQQSACIISLWGSSSVFNCCTKIYWILKIYRLNMLLRENDWVALNISSWNRNWKTGFLFELSRMDYLLKNYKHVKLTRFWLQEKVTVHWWPFRNATTSPDCHKSNLPQVFISDV